MLRRILAFFREENHGQDLVEYTLLLAFVALVVIVLFTGASGSVQGIWSTSNTTLAAANSTASGASAPAAASDPGGAGAGAGAGGTGGGDHHDGDGDHH